MSEYDCKTCGEFMLTDAHRCKPEWHVWDPENADREDADTIRASTAEYAAEEWADDNDANYDYGIVSGCPVTVCVAPVGGGPSELFEVTGESVPSYSARSKAAPAAETSEGN